MTQFVKVGTAQTVDGRVLLGQETVDAIAALAVAVERARIRAAVEALPLTGMGHDIPRAAVLALLEANHDR